MEIIRTDESKTYIAENCDCGLTGGCPTCRPITLSFRMSHDKLFMELVEKGLVDLKNGNYKKVSNATQN